MESVFSEAAIGEGVEFSRIQFPTDVTPIEKYTWIDKKYKLITSDGEFIKTKEEILAMPNFKSDIILDPVLELKKRTYTVDFKINNGVFTTFAPKAHQEYTEDIAGQGISFNKVEFPEASGVNIGTNQWDGFTFKYKGENKTKNDLLTLVFKENIELTIDPKVMPTGFKAVFIKTNGVHYDGNIRNHITMANAPNYKITSIPRVELGLTEKVYNELYNFSNKWKMHTVKIEAGTEAPDQYIQDIRNTELLDHVFDKDLALVPILGKKTINAVFIPDDSKFSYPSGFSKSQPIQVENMGDLSIPASKIVFTRYLVLKPGYKWNDYKYTFKQGEDPEIIGTPDELKTQIITKGPVLLTPIVTQNNLPKATYKVEFIIKDGGEFTIFQGKEVQEFTEEVAGEGIPFSKVEFPGAGDINASPFVWDGVTFGYKGKITTAARLKAEDKTFNENIILMLMTEIGEYKVTFFRMDGVYYDRVNHELEYLVEYPEFKFKENLPRVDLGLEENTKYMNRLYRYTDKWDIYKNDNSTNWNTNNFFKTMTTDEFKNYKIDNELGVYPNLEKKDIDVVFEEGGTDYAYPTEFEKHQKLQVEKIGDKAISISKIKFPATVITAEGVTTWEGKRWIIRIEGKTDTLTGTKEELSTKTFDNKLYIKPVVSHLPPPSPSKPAEFDTKVALTENDKEYWIKASDKTNWDNNQKVEGWDDTTKTKENIKKLTILEAYTHPVVDRGEGHFNIRPYDIPKWERGEKIMGEFRGSLMEIQWIPDIQYYTLAVNHWDGNTYKIHPGNQVRYEGRAEVDALNSSNAVVKIKKKTPEEDGFTLQVKHFGNGNRYNIKPEDKTKWDSYQEVDCCNMETELKPVIKYKNIRISELFDTEIWLKGKKYYIMHGSGWSNNDYTTEIACWDGHTQYETQYEVTKFARENLSTTYTKDVKMDGKTWKINPTDETNWNNRAEIPAWNGIDPWCKNLITRPNYDTIYTKLVTNRDNKKYYIEPGHEEDWKKSVELDGTTEEDRNTKIKVKRIHVKDVYTTLVFDEEHYGKYYIKPEDVPKWNNFEKVYGITQYNMDNLFWDDSVIQQYRKLHMNEKFKYEVEQNGKKYYLRTSDDLMSYYEFIQVKAWKGVIDDYLDENAYETIKRPDIEPPVKSNTPTTPGKVKVTFWGGPNCDFTDMTNPTTVELTEDQPDGASLENLTFPHIKFKSFIRTDIGYGLKEGEWKISFLSNGKWKTLQRITSSIKKMIIKGNVLIQPNPGKQR